MASTSCTNGCNNLNNYYLKIQKKKIVAIQESNSNNNINECVSSCLLGIDSNFG